MKLWSCAGALGLAGSVAACQQSDSGRGVYFGDAPAVGAWHPVDPTMDGQGSNTQGSNAQVTSAQGMTGGGAGGNAPGQQTGTGGASGGMKGAGGAFSGGAGAQGTGGMSRGTGGLPGIGGALGGGGGTGGSAAGGGNTGAFSFDVTTINQGGRFAPRNVGAIWIEDSSGKFVKTLKVWAATRARYLTKFSSEAMSNRVDAVTSATIGQFGPQHATWNLTDVSRAPVANGAYKVVIEVTDHDGTGQNASMDFMLTGMPQSTTGTDTQWFTGLKVTVQ